MRIAKIILMTLIFSVMVINLIFAFAFHDWYTYSGWFLALWFCGIAYFTELSKEKMIKDLYIDMETLYKKGSYNTKEIRAKENNHEISMQAPKHLDKVARERWQYTVKELGSLLTYLDEPILVMYCESYSACQKLKRTLEGKEV